VRRRCPPSLHGAPPRVAVPELRPCWHPGYLAPRLCLLFGVAGALRPQSSTRDAHGTRADPARWRCRRRRCVWNGTSIPGDTPRRTMRGSTTCFPPRRGGTPTGYTVLRRAEGTCGAAGNRHDSGRHFVFFASWGNDDAWGARVGDAALRSSKETSVRLLDTEALRERVATRCLADAAGAPYVVTVNTPDEFGAREQSERAGYFRPPLPAVGARPSLRSPHQLLGGTVVLARPAPAPGGDDGTGFRSAARNPDTRRGGDPSSRLPGHDSAWARWSAQSSAGSSPEVGGEVGIKIELPQEPGLPPSLTVEARHRRTVRDLQIQCRAARRGV